jgi:hypothetical protein
MRSIGLKDGIIADLGFDNWFPKSFRDHAHIFKTHLKNYL